MSYKELKEYLEHLREDTGFFGVAIDWNVIRTEGITAYSSGKRMGLQIADAVASGFWYAVEASRLGFTEDRYARMLKPVVYRHKNQYLGYGLKFFPREVDDDFLTAENLAWVKTDFH